MTTMMINDLEDSKELDHDAMLAIRGGADDATQFAFNSQELFTEAKAGIAAVNTAIQTLVGVNTNLVVAPVTEVNLLGGPA
jgi:hypothetical protein